MEAYGSTWPLGYQEDDQMEKALETMKKVILASHQGWKPNLATLAGCLEYLKGKYYEKRVVYQKRLVTD